MFIKQNPGQKIFHRMLIFDYIYYYWDNDGLWEGGCDSCLNQTANTISLTAKHLLLKNENPTR